MHALRGLEETDFRGMHDLDAEFIPEGNATNTKDGAVHEVDGLSHRPVRPMLRNPAKIATADWSHFVRVSVSGALQDQSWRITQQRV